MKKIVIIAALMIFATHLSAQIVSADKGIKPVSDKSLIVSLNGNWKFQFIPNADWSKYKDFFLEGYNDSQWGTIPVPGNWDALGYTLPKYAHPDDLTGLYRTTFSVPDNWKNQHLILKFDGVLRGYELWVNGQYVGKWESAYNSCQFDVTEFLTGKENRLAVRVYTRFKGFDFDGNDDWGQVGITGDVTMFPVPDTHVKDLTITTRLAEQNATVGLDFEVGNFSKSATQALQIKGKIVSPNGKTAAEFTLPIAPNAAVHKEIAVKQAQLWNAETPHLYLLRFQLMDGKKVLQSFSENFGIREVSIEKDVLKLNGVALKLRGVTLHATDPFHGKVISEELNLADMKLMKAASINFIRTSHYPREPRFYELCDSLGFYVMSEVPFGFGDHQLFDTSFQDILLTRAEATVQRDKNHTSILFWSIGNENPLTPIAEETGKYVKRKDATRPICYPMVHDYFLSLKYNIPDFVDIYAPHYPPVETLKYYAATATKPVILTEYCHSLGQSLEEHRELWELVEANKNLAGGNVWEWVDQGMIKKGRKTNIFKQTEDLWLNDSTAIIMDGNSGADGIVYANRVPLTNYYEVRKNYAQVQILDNEINLSKGKHQIPVHFNNRFDFINLQGNIECNWYLTADKDTVSKGTFSPACAPHKQCEQQITIHLNQDPSEKIYLVHFDVKTKEGLSINQQTIRILPATGKINFNQRLTAEQNTYGRIQEFIQQAPLMRVGRKTSMSEDARIPSKVIKNYLMTPTVSNGNHYLFENEDIAVSGKINYSVTKQEGIKVDFNLQPAPSDKILLEAGIAVLLDKSITKVQWLGNGPYSSYPGKANANNYGIHALAQEDIYFEGNRMGIDLVLCTNDSGDGVLLACDNGNVNFERTDQGIVLSFNSLVSGLGGKLRPTSFPVYANEIDSIAGSFSLYYVDGKNWQPLLKDIFVPPNKIKKAYTPFISVYDTYLKRFVEI
ncbi:beta-galactosidase [Bacteroidia bacterium]|nr:beta-galactosidase [Bacteroidia bacterium]